MPFELRPIIRREFSVDRRFNARKDTTVKRGFPEKSIG
jgi:hypothetical protein